MLYKKISLPLLPVACLALAGGCLNGQKTNSGPVIDHKHPLQNNKGNAPMLLLSSCVAPGSISCIEGKKTDFLLKLGGSISNIDLQSDVEVAFIGVSGGAALSLDAPIVQAAIGLKNEVEKFQWIEDQDNFVYWNKRSKVSNGKQEWIIPVPKEVYEKLTSKNYAIHMLCLQNGTPAISTTPFQMDIPGNHSSLPDYESIGLEAVESTAKTMAGHSAYSLKGKIASGWLEEDQKVGFILIQEEKASNLYNFLQNVIVSENGWPTEAMAFNGEMIIVPAKLRPEQPNIITDLLSADYPAQGGKFKMFAYFIKDNQHYYFSQMQYVLPDVTDSSLSGEAPPSIQFTGNEISLKVLDLKLLRRISSGQVKDAKLLPASFEYSVNDLPAALPSDQEAGVVFIPLDTVWRTSILESLFKKLRASNSNASITDDGTICLISDLNKPLDKSSIDFFSSAPGYQYFPCLFSRDDHKLIFYTQKQDLVVEEKESKPQPKEEPKSAEPKITLDTTWHITFHKPEGMLSVTQKNYFTHTPLPKPTPISFELGNLKQGYLITDEGAKDSIAENIHFIESFIDSDKLRSSDGQFLFFKANIETREVNAGLYHKYNAVFKKVSPSLYISYWVEYNNKIIFSDPQEITVDRK